MGEAYKMQTYHTREIFLRHRGCELCPFPRLVRRGEERPVHGPLLMPVRLPPVPRHMVPRILRQTAHREVLPEVSSHCIAPVADSDMAAAVADVVFPETAYGERNLKFHYMNAEGEVTSEEDEISLPVFYDHERVLAKYERKIRAAFSVGCAVRR